MDTSAFALESTSKLVDRFEKEVRRVSRVRTPDAMHDVRVATRRLHQSLEVFEDEFLAPGLKRLRETSKRILKAAGKVRNFDIAIALCTEAKQSPPEGTDEQRRKAADELVDLARAWKAVPIAAKPHKQAAKTIEVFAADILPAMASKFFRAGRKAQDHGAGSKSLHAFRLKSKRFRYTLELFAPLFAKGWQDRVEAVERIQHLLGEVSDCQASVEILKQDPAMVQFLDKRERENLKKFQKLWQKKIDKDGEKRGWMKYLRHPVPLEKESA